MIIIRRMKMINYNKNDADGEYSSFSISKARYVLTGNV